MTDRTVRDRIVDHHGGDAVERIAPGDLLIYTRSVWRAIATREVNSRKWPDRWMITMEHLGPPPASRAMAEETYAIYGSFKTVPLVRYRKGERPGEVPCGSPGCEGCGGTP